ncbi:hypothetical protein BJV77DRAFT_1035949, partial [Russula vinacea]
LKPSDQARQSTHLFATLPSSSPASKTPSQTVRGTHRHECEVLQEMNCCGTSKLHEKAAPPPVVVPSTLVMCPCARVLFSARHHSTCIDPAKEERSAALFASWVQEVGSHHKYEPGADGGRSARRRSWRRYSALQGTETYRGLISDTVFLLHASNR